MRQSLFIPFNSCISFPIRHHSLQYAPCFRDYSKTSEQSAQRSYCNAWFSVFLLNRSDGAALHRFFCSFQGFFRNIRFYCLGYAILIDGKYFGADTCAESASDACFIDMIFHIVPPSRNYSKVSSSAILNCFTAFTACRPPLAKWKFSPA